MKKILYGIAAGFTLGAIAQAIASKNQAKLLELTKNLPTHLTLSPNASLDELKVHKARLEDLIKDKSQELKDLGLKTASEFAEKGQKKAGEYAEKGKEQLSKLRSSQGHEDKDS